MDEAKPTTYEFIELEAVWSVPPEKTDARCSMWLASERQARLVARDRVAFACALDLEPDAIITQVHAYRCTVPRQPPKALLFAALNGKLAPKRVAHVFGDIPLLQAGVSA